MRVAVGTDPVTGRNVQRSVTFHGSGGQAEAFRGELAAEHAGRRAAVRAAPLLTVAELLDRGLATGHRWRPSTWRGYRSKRRRAGP